MLTPLLHFERPAILSLQPGLDECCCEPVRPRQSVAFGSDIQGCNITEIRNGKAIRTRLYADNATLLQQIGVPSPGKTMSAG
jgi:hypothetical protein